MEPYYQDGSCTIYHGDCLEVLPSLPESIADSVLTDPPFKLSQAYSSNVDADNLSAVSSILLSAEGLFRVAKDGAPMVLFYDTRILPFALDAFRRGGWRYLRALTFYRRWGQAHKLYGWMSTSDFILVFVKPGEALRFFGPWKHDVYVKDQAELFDAGHPAQKPEAVVGHLVGNVTVPGGLVLDAYMGSGTTLAVAARLGYKAIGIEAEERYCELAAQRLAQEVLPLDA